MNSHYTHYFPNSGSTDRPLKNLLICSQYLVSAFNLLICSFFSWLLMVNILENINFFKGKRKITINPITQRKPLFTVSSI